MKYFFYAGVLIFFTTSCKKEGVLVENKLEGYWKLRSFTISPPLLGAINDLTPFLNPCATLVTYYFRPDGTTTFVDVPDNCKGDLEGINLNTDAISRWKFEGEKLIIYNDYSPEKDEYTFVKTETTMVWRRMENIPIPTNLGENLNAELSLTFFKIK